MLFYICFFCVCACSVIFVNVVVVVERIYVNCKFQVVVFCFVFIKTNSANGHRRCRLFFLCCIFLCSTYYIYVRKMQTPKIKACVVCVLK